MWYFIGSAVAFILCIFYIALIHNKKLIEKYEWIENRYNSIKNYPDYEFIFMLCITIFWLIAIIIVIVIGLGYCLYKIFTKLIDHFVK